MRLALQKLLGNPSATSILRSAVHSDGAGFCQHYSHSTPTPGRSRYTAKEKEREQLLGPETRPFWIRKLPSVTKDNRRARGGIDPKWPDIPEAHARLPNAQKFEDVDGARLSRSTVRPDLQVLSVTKQDMHSGNLKSRTHLRPPTKAEGNSESWRDRLATFEQYQYESNLEAPASRDPRLVDYPIHAQNWDLWLELITFRKRHNGSEGTMAIYKEVFRRDLRLPTLGNTANQLWDLLIRAGFYDSGFLEEIVAYATCLKRSTGRSWPGIYYGVVSVALKKDVDSAYSWHLKLRNDFPPAIGDYKRMFKLSLDWGSSVHFRNMYRDTPLIGMYRTVIWHLCKLQMYDEALEWHDLLYDSRDFPTRPTDTKPLLDHLAYIGDGHRLEKIVGMLTEAKVGISNAVENFVRKDAPISREIMNRQLGKVHGFGPKHLSDSFCARLFATRLFSVDTIISGLQMMAVEEIGPLSLREIAVRDNYDPGAICHHTDSLKNAGISLDTSLFCAVVRSLAVEDKRILLKSIVSCDLHPDAFADFDLQERLLAQYYKENDLMKIERTLAILTTGCSVTDLQMVRMNLILRCQITLGKAEKVLATLREMKYADIPVSIRSSRHLRVRWLSRRQVGRGADETKELGIIIQASRMTMQSGRFVPIIAWREILRRLGMAGRLTELENLALWLVDWYLSPVAKAALPKRTMSSDHGDQSLIEGHASLENPEPNRDTQRFLSTLFTTSAQHAIVAWGFQHLVTSRSSIRRFKKASMETDHPRFQWTWGLHLLYKLRERGVPISRSEVARICRHRLNTLFGIGFSKRKINRRARSEQNSLESYTESVYIRKMEAIWGKGLFKVWRHAEYRDVAKKMVAKGKTYGKKRARDLVAIFGDLSITPSKPGANAITRILAPTPNSHNEPLLALNAEPEEELATETAEQGNAFNEPPLESNAAPEGEQAAEIADQDDNKENRPTRKAGGKQSGESTLKNQTPTEISELTSLPFVENEIVDFRKFCKGWEKEFKLSKIGQGSFATVLKMELKTRPGQYSVWKLMPLKPSKGSGSRPYHHQTLIKDAATEVRMLFAMSDVDGFVQFRSAYVVKGRVPDQIGRAHDTWAKNLDPEDTWYETNMSTEYPSANQLWLLMEMTDAGQDIDCMLCTARLEQKLYSIHETSDMFWGIAEALMRGEAHAEFEHRDLHPGNICIKVRDEPLDLTTEQGIPRVSKHEVTLIDYTQSRLTLESGDVPATAIDESIFRQIGDDLDAQRQYDVYRAMRDIVKKSKKPGVTISQMWKEYVPMTNVLWLHHILKELMAVTQKTSESQEELDMIVALNSLVVELSPGISKPWKYSSAGEVVCGFLLDPRVG